MPTSQRRPVNKHSKCKTHRCKTRNRFLHGLLFVFAALMLYFGLFLWRAALELNAPAESAVSVSAEDFRPVVGDPPYRVAIDAGHGGSDPGATSSLDARGLMQMTEETFLRLRSKLGLGEEVSFGDLYDPDVSIRFGCYYLHLCLVRYNGDISTAAAAYHSGWGTVDALLQKEEHSEDGLTLSGFPYNQMHHYVEKITACYAKYTELYGA